MRIIKGVPNYIQAIAGEIANIELCELRFIDGEPVATPTKGYPCVTAGTVRTTIKTSIGYIIVPDTTDIRQFKNVIADAVSKLVSHAPTPHTIVSGITTAVKATPRVISTHGEMDVVKRAFLDVPDYNNAQFDDQKGHRFTWGIMRASKFPFAIYADDGGQSIARHVCSVFYDPYDLVALEHNAVVPELKKSDMRAFDRISTAQTLFWDHRVDMLTLNAGKIKISPIFAISAHKLYAATMRDVILCPGDDDVLRCSQCEGAIHGEFYAMDGLLSDLDNPYSVPYCAVCGHMRADELYARVFRIDSGIPRDVALAELADPVRDIIIHGSTSAVTDGGAVLLGTKYIAMPEIVYLMTPHAYADRVLVSLRHIVGTVIA